MIFNKSRYSGGRIGQAYDRHSDKPTVYVFRKFSVRSTDVSYYEYLFKDGDSLDLIAATFYGTSKDWHFILDVNPEIPDPFHIKPGTVIRIPIV